MRSLPGFKIKDGKSSLLLQQIERNNANSVLASPGSKSIEDEDKGIAEILMLQQRTVLQVLRYFFLYFDLSFGMKINICIRNILNLSS